MTVSAHLLIEIIKKIYPFVFVYLHTVLCIFFGFKKKYFYLFIFVLKKFLFGQMPLLENTHLIFGHKYLDLE